MATELQNEPLNDSPSNGAESETQDATLNISFSCAPGRESKWSLPIRKTLAVAITMVAGALWGMEKFEQKKERDYYRTFSRSAIEAGLDPSFEKLVALQKLVDSQENGLADYSEVRMLTYTIAELTADEAFQKFSAKILNDPLSFDNPVHELHKFSLEMGAHSNADLSYFEVKDLLDEYSRKRIQHLFQRLVAGEEVNLGSYLKDDTYRALVGTAEINNSSEYLSAGVPKAVLDVHHALYLLRGVRGAITEIETETNHLVLNTDLDVGLSLLESVEKILGPEMGPLLDSYKTRLLVCYGERLKGELNITEKRFGAAEWERKGDSSSLFHKTESPARHLMRLERLISDFNEQIGLEKIAKISLTDNGWSRERWNSECRRKTFQYCSEELTTYGERGDVSSETWKSVGIRDIANELDALSWVLRNERTYTQTALKMETHEQLLSHLKKEGSKGTSSGSLSPSMPAKEFENFFDTKLTKPRHRD